LDLTIHRSMTYTEKNGLGCSQKNSVKLKHHHTEGIMEYLNFTQSMLILITQKLIKQSTL
jgi:hypothetical protein